MPNFDGVVFDVDGTILRGTTPIPGAAETVRAVRESGARVAFVTNNPTRTPASYVEKLADAGVPAAAEEVVTSGSATAAFLASEHAGDAAFVVGERGLHEQVADAGLRVVSEPPAADGVVASIDREFTYDRLAGALRAFERGVDWFVGTDPDRTIPTDEGLVPGSGAVVESVAAVAERRPDAVLGKPHPFTRDLVFDRLGCDPADALVVGDRLDTDVAFGERAGATTVLVETGVATRADAAASDVTPDHVFAAVTGVRDLL
ncbi:HAD-IIA family hydrolase [Halorubellus sp. JP-L1]|uniref:HAD-IIA family hydrolase n=1 Tax=Halorubellus sp. JP-L1 TaxID=2715753 RepID=UPI00140BE3C0|nr:HAD-IIA family hydrolase [Halorubellus sp. JP-L1]NHN40378.1 HAD-IIA family hydrolase [Halorubellus sp. JP-L1]